MDMDMDMDMVLSCEARGFVCAEVVF